MTKVRSQKLKICALSMMVLLGLAFLSACTSSTNNESKTGEPMGDIQKISPEDARSMMQSDNAVMLDVRNPDEYASGHIEGAVLLPVDEINVMSAADHIPDHTTPVIVYCHSGVRSEAAARTLIGLGYENVYDLGGIISWPYGTTQ